MLTECRRAPDFRRRCRKLDRHSHVEPFPALRMIQFDPPFASADVFVVREVLGRHDRTARHVEWVEYLHQLTLRMLLRELVDKCPHELLVPAPIADLRKSRVVRKI